MKTWIKATIFALLALFASSCTLQIGSYYEEDDYDIYGTTWSKIIESSTYRYFECYDFYENGTYTYWYYENDKNVRVPKYDIMEGHFELRKYGWEREIKFWGIWGSDTYNLDELLHGMSDMNSPSSISFYKRLIDDLSY
ncbi:MAG: hypothetical protein MJZ00_05740 [Paludibacteraceae bacterium]|nr:hypothetical protein [Paludibacteraceae bacterium]